MKSFLILYKDIFLCNHKIIQQANMLVKELVLQQKKSISKLYSNTVDKINIKH